MSCNEWERGEWQLSCAEYPRLRRAIIIAKNQIQAERHAKAVEIHAKLLVLVKGKRRDGLDWRDTINSIMFPRNNPNVSYWEHWDEGIYNSIMFDTVPLTDNELKARYNFCSEGVWEQHRGETHMVKRTEPRKPQKKDFPLATRTTTKFTIDDGGADLRFNDEKRTVHWSVEENNHACDRAHEDKLAIEFFRLLKTVVWTRGTGGKIIGNDEYHQESGENYEGGGGSYSKGEWGAMVGRLKKTPKPALYSFSQRGY